MVMHSEKTMRDSEFLVTARTKRACGALRCRETIQEYAFGDRLSIQAKLFTRAAQSFKLGRGTGAVATHGSEAPERKLRPKINRSFFRYAPSSPVHAALSHL